MRGGESAQTSWVGEGSVAARQPAPFVLASFRRRNKGRDVAQRAGRVRSGEDMEERVRNPREGFYGSCTASVGGVTVRNVMRRCLETFCDAVVKNQRIRGAELPFSAPLFSVPLCRCVTRDGTARRIPERRASPSRRIWALRDQLELRPRAAGGRQPVECVAQLFHAPPHHRVAGQRAA